MGAQEVWDKSLVPDRFRSMKLEELRGISTQVREWALDYCDRYPDLFSPKNRNGLYLYSPIPGNGKSAVAVAIMRELIERKKARRIATFAPMIDVLEWMHEARRQDVAFADYGPAARLFDSDLLVLDDMGKGRFTDYIATQYYYLVNRLYNDCRHVIFTSNYPLSALARTLNQAREDKDMFGQSVVSRIHEMTEVIQFSGQDYRIGV